MLETPFARVTGAGRGLPVFAWVGPIGACGFAAPCFDDQE